MSITADSTVSWQASHTQEVRIRYVLTIHALPNWRQKQRPIAWKTNLILTKLVVTSVQKTKQNPDFLLDSLSVVWKTEISWVRIWSSGQTREPSGRQDRRLSGKRFGSPGRLFINEREFKRKHSQISKSTKVGKDTWRQEGNVIPRQISAIKIKKISSSGEILFQVTSLCQWKSDLKVTSPSSNWCTNRKISLWPWQRWGRLW